MLESVGITREIKKQEQRLADLEQRIDLAQRALSATKRARRRVENAVKVQTWGRSNMHTVSTRLQNSKAERFRRACEAVGKNMYEVLGEAAAQFTRAVERRRRCGKKGLWAASLKLKELPQPTVEKADALPRGE